jgi:hypothetical protein
VNYLWRADAGEMVEDDRDSSKTAQRVELSEAE